MLSTHVPDGVKLTCPAGGALLRRTGHGGRGQRYIVVVQSEGKYADD